ncbi:MAG: YIP1 family protein [Candidatus Obscuribacterales bacterium]|nr:YIP1 family protein [Candidatus Obscuribacterales bacterium]
MGTPEEKRLQNYISGDDSTDIAPSSNKQDGQSDPFSSWQEPANNSPPQNVQQSWGEETPLSAASNVSDSNKAINEHGESAKKSRAEFADNQLVPAFTAFFWDYIAVSKEVLTHPSSFFSQISVESGLTKPALFLAFSALGTTFLTSVFNGFHILKIPGAFVFEIVACIMVSGAAMTLAKGQGSKASFESVFRVFAYCSCLGWFAGLPVIGMLVGPAGLVYNFIGLKQVLKLNNFQLVTVMGLLCLLKVALLIARAFQH